MKNSTANRFSVTGKTVIITGASRGIGKAIAQGFLDAGANVVLVSRSQHDIENDRALSLPQDVAQPNAAEEICAGAVDRFGGIDVLINNAGITDPDDEPYGEAAWDKTMDINLKAAFLLSTAVSRQMQARHDGGAGGSIINIASAGALLGFPNNPSYQAAKGGLVQLTRAMARDLAKYNIRVNAICPGYIRTAMTDRSYNDPDLRQQRSERMMLSRWGQPDDLVGPCVFLASEAADYVTGTVLPVDGGLTAKGI
jgi:NAD(P)-dependent dehydrogenase (short-subunit alcohol dehydrogenase family)